MRVWRSPELRRHRRAVVDRPIRRLGHCGASVEVPVGIHPLVEYTHHIDHVVAANPVVQRVRSDSLLAVARADVIAGPSDRRIGHDAFDRTLGPATSPSSTAALSPSAGWYLDARSRWQSQAPGQLRDGTRGRWAKVPFRHAAALRRSPQETRAWLLGRRKFRTLTGGAMVRPPGLGAS